LARAIATYLPIATDVDEGFGRIAIGVGRFCALWFGGWVSNSIYRQKTRPRAKSTRQRRGFGSQSCHSAKPNRRTSYGNKKWMDRMPNSPTRQATANAER
jgi:hypothetical protein